MKDARKLVYLWMFLLVCVGMFSCSAHSAVINDVDFDSSPYVAGERVEGVEGWNVWQEQHRDTICIVAGEGIDGSQAMKVIAPGSELSIRYSLALTGDEQEVWFDFYVKLIGPPTGFIQFFTLTDDGAGNTAALVRITPDGYRLIGNNGNLIGSVTWVWDEEGEPVVSEGVWTRLSIYHDVKRKRWDLYMDEVPIYSDFGYWFGGRRSEVQWFWINVEAQVGKAGCLIDDFRVTTEKPF